MADSVDEPAVSRVGLREVLTDAIQYWERRRWVYNATLAVVVLTCFFLQWPSVLGRLSFQSWLFLFINAVLANVAYCSAYIVDVVLQYSSLRQAWRKRRWYLLIIGTMFASAITYLVSIALFYPGD